MVAGIGGKGAGGLGIAQKVLGAVGGLLGGGKGGDIMQMVQQLLGSLGSQAGSSKGCVGGMCQKG